ncbi:hypothetical protein JOE11_001542 [Robbsia andropogonis]
MTGDDRNRVLCGFPAAPPARGPCASGSRHRRPVTDEACGPAFIGNPHEGGVTRPVAGTDIISEMSLA